MNALLNRMTLCVALGATPLLAHADSYAWVDPSASTLSFSYTQMGVSLDGRFPRFEAQLTYDPAAPEAASTIIEVPIAPIDTGSTEGDEEVQGKDWFATAAHPVARFTSTRVEVVAPDRLTVVGILSIKGQERTLSIPVSVTHTPAQASFDGRFELNRTDFGIGAGSWAKDDVVAHAVSVSFHIVARP